MALPLARTPKESHLYIELHACECGEADVEHRSHSTGQGDGYWISHYDLTCPGCGADREFAFRVPDWPSSTGGYGGSEPSEIIDAGQWLIIADLTASAVPVTPSRAAKERAEQRRTLEMAVDAMTEILKFVPGREPAVPDSAFWTPEGRAQRDREPGRFHRDRLEVVLDSYRRALARFS
ncbi:hypothetical protein ACIBVL_29855 [Streptomyces sp. NPDC049687]|uniref:hypothetical protein n=1 Tax=Streptomyces sp. NPDC049687 TaxID=3365596 RepID=UPI0037B517ED